MPDVIKTTYMGQPVHASNEYMFKDIDAMNNIKPRPGDRCTLATDGTEYFCWDDTWEKIESAGGGGGASITVDAEMSDTSENPVQNKVINKAIVDLQQKLNSLENVNEVMF